MEMRTAGLALDNLVLYTIFIDVFAAEYEVEERNLASHNSIGREETIKPVRERHHRFSGNRKKGLNAGHAMYAGDGSGRGRGGGRGSAKGGRRGTHGRCGRGTNEDGSGSAAASCRWRWQQRHSRRL